MRRKIACPAKQWCLITAAMCQHDHGRRRDARITVHGEKEAVNVEMLLSGEEVDRAKTAKRVLSIRNPLSSTTSTGKLFRADIARPFSCACSISP
ncbi:hypothetical protein M8494_20520 [Serratia ureilytica]